MAPTDSHGREPMDEAGTAGAGNQSCRHSCLQGILEELKPEHVAPTHKATRLFVDSQWSIGNNISTIYLVYRVTIAVLLVAWLFCDFLLEAGGWYSYDYRLWFLFATNWSLICIVTVSVMMASSTSYYYVQTRLYKREFPSPIPIGLSIQWVMYNIAYNSAIVVSFGYWSYLMLSDIQYAQFFMLSPMSQMKHSFNTVFILIDLFVNAIPIRIYHLVYPLVVGTIYAVFNAAYFLSDHLGPEGLPFVYSAMDWRNPLGSTITCFLAFIFSCLVQLVLFGLYKLRLFASHRMQKAVDVDVNGYNRRASGEASSVLADDERGPIFPNGFDLGGNGVSFHANAGYQSMETSEHIVNGK